MRFRSSRLIAAALVLSPLALGCEEEAPPEPAAPAIEVSPLSLVVAKRSDATPPEGALVVSAAPEGIVVNGTTIPLEAGRLPANEWSGERIPSLTAAIDAVGAPQAAILRLHASVPYETVSRILATINAHGTTSFFFEVRPGSSAQTGHLPVVIAGTRAPSHDPVVFEGPGQRSWQEFVDLWGEMVEHCQGEGMVDCNPKLEPIAEGGLVEIELFTRQDAMRVLVRRHGVEGESVEEPPDLMPPQNSRTKPAIDEAAAPPPAPIARSATFMWRKRAATAEPSPISLTMRPLCGAQPCAIRMAGDPLTPIAQVVQLLGAAFPNGAPVPVVLWEMPAP